MAFEPETANPHPVPAVRVCGWSPTDRAWVRRQLDILLSMQADSGRGGFWAREIREETATLLRVLGIDTHDDTET